MPGLKTSTAGGLLTINSVSLNTPAWIITNLVDLQLGAELRGQDRIIPHAAGVVPYPRRFTVTERHLPMLISGDVDRFGTQQSNVHQGLQANLTYLRTNVLDPPNTTTSLRAAVLTLPTGATRAANVHVLGLDIGDQYFGQHVMRGGQGYVLRAVLRLSIPAGVFA